MQSSSDTEPESDYEALSQPTSRPYNCDETEHHRHTEAKTTQFDSVLSAVRFLEQGNPVDVCHDIVFRTAIFQCFDRFGTFLDDINETTVSTTEKLRTVVQWPDFVYLANPPFLSILFDYRSALRRVSQEYSCIVDNMLSRLSICATIVAGGPNLNGNNNTPTPIRQRLQEDCILSATQLPDKWSSLLRIFQVRSTSPGAVRLSLRLLFLAYVMAPHLADTHESWLDDLVSATQVKEAISCYLDRIGREDISQICEGSLCSSDLDNHAIAISVFAVAHQGCQDVDSPHSTYIFRHSGTILSLIMAILRSVESDRLSLAQTIILRWGDFVPWCWSVWNDDRLADRECITDLTMSWILWLDMPFCVQTSRTGFRGRAHSLAVQHSEAFGKALCNLLQSITSSVLRSGGKPSSELTSVFERACWALVKLLQRNAVVSDTTMEGQAPMACRLLIDAFLLVSTQDLLDGLVCIPLGTFSATIGRLFREPSAQFASRIHSIAADTKKCIHKVMHEPALNLARTNLTRLDILNTVHLLSLILHVRRDERLLQGDLLFLIRNASSVQAYLTGDDSSLRAALVIATAVLERIAPRVAADIPEDTVWGLVLSNGSLSLAATASFACFVLASTRKFDALNHVEAYNHLLDALVAAVSGHTSEDGEQILALLVVPSICLALEKLLKNGPPFLVGYMVSSPWTTSLKEKLEILIKRCGDASADGYESMLYEKTKKTIRRLLELRMRLQGDSPSREIEPEVNADSDDILKWRWISWHGRAGLNLILVP